MFWCLMDWQCRRDRKLEQPAGQLQREGHILTTETPMAMTFDVDSQWGFAPKHTTSAQSQETQEC